MATREVSSFVERYQLLYEKDPDSRVFAPLAEAYRRMGLIDEAIDLAEKGVAKHPLFASGRVALGKCLVQKGFFERAVEQLKAAVELSPENLLAHQLLAECYARLKRPVEALDAYKMALFLNPTDTRIASVVKMLENLLHEDAMNQEAPESFAVGRLDEAAKPDGVFAQQVSTSAEEIAAREAAATGGAPNSAVDRALERELALMDARFDRGDWAPLRDQLHELLAKHPEHPEILKRKHYLDEMTQNSFHSVDWLSPINPDVRQAQLQKLKDLLERVEGRRKA